MTLNEFVSALQKLKKGGHGNSNISILTEDSCINNAEIVYTLKIDADSPLIIRLGETTKNDS
jgi:hypothetical protein